MNSSNGEIIARLREWRLGTMAINLHKILNGLDPPPDIFLLLSCAHDSKHQHTAHLVAVLPSMQQKVSRIAHARLSFASPSWLLPATDLGCSIIWNHQAMRQCAYSSIFACLLEVWRQNQDHVSICVPTVLANMRDTHKHHIHTHVKAANPREVNPTPLSFPYRIVSAASIPLRVSIMTRALAGNAPRIPLKPGLVLLCGLPLISFLN